MKIKEMQKELRKKKIDFALFLNIEFDAVEPNIFYFSGYSGSGALVIPKNKKPFLVVHEMEYEKAKKTKIKAFVRKKGKRITETILGILKKKNIRKIAIDKSFVTLNVHKAIKKTFKKAKTTDISGFCLKLREIKTKEEIKRIKEACRISDSILRKFFSNLKKFRTETEAKTFLENETKKNRCSMAFTPIVASGKNSSMPHSDENRKMSKGFCVVDFGITYKGYCSDTTRTFYIGKINKKEKEIYNFLLNVQKEVIKKIKLGVRGGYLHSEALRMLNKYKNNFTHGLGHGIGVKVHELPNLTELSKDKIQKNMVFTVEPGIYFENKFGIRIEDTVLMENKAVRLTKATKDLLIV